MSPKLPPKSLNVMKGPLLQFSKEPMTGFYRNGYCDVGPDDTGNHAIAATLTSEFLDFTASKGNDLKSIGLKPGQKWCLCIPRWQEAMKAAKDEYDAVVPKVHLHATHQSALKTISIADLKKFAAEGEAANASTVAQSTHGGMGGKIRQRTELVGKGEMTNR